METRVIPRITPFPGLVGMFLPMDHSTPTVKSRLFAKGRDNSRLSRFINEEIAEYDGIYHPRGKDLTEDELRDQDFFRKDGSGRD